MNKTGDAMPFLTPGNFVETDFLRLLARKVPRNIAEQLDGDGQPELGLSKSVSIADLIRPLSTYAFPSDHLDGLSSVLVSMMVGYQLDVTEKRCVLDPYKFIYACSLYLYGFVHGKCPADYVWIPALAMLADISASSDLETRLQVCRFLGSLLPTICSEETFLDSGLVDEFAPASSAFLALSVIVGSIASKPRLAAVDRTSAGSGSTVAGLGRDDIAPLPRPNGPLHDRVGATDVSTVPRNVAWFDYGRPMMWTVVTTGHSPLGLGILPGSKPRPATAVPISSEIGTTAACLGYRVAPRCGCWGRLAPARRTSRPETFLSRQDV